MRSVVLVLLCACGSGAAVAPRTEEVVGSRAAGTPDVLGSLGMNDVSILLPLPADPRAPVLTTIAGDGAPLVGRDWFDALVTAHGDLAPSRCAGSPYDPAGKRLFVIDHSATPGRLDRLHIMALAG
jgi:hypothetical protein